MALPNREEAMKMRKMAALGMALAVGSFALIGLDPAQAVAADPHVAIHSGSLREAVTTVGPGDEVTWINVTGNPVVHLDFESAVDGQGYHRLFTSSTTLQFTRPGVYPYTIYVGARALPLRGEIVVK